jgi:hypothetical protein
MRGFSLRSVWLVLSCVVVLAAAPLRGEQESFRWVDFHAAADQDIIVWVTRALAPEKWTSIREIGVLYDAALVVTTERANPEASPAGDTFDIWSVSLTNHALTPLLKGVNLRWLDWMHVRDGSPRELTALYDDCAECAVTTYFTSFHYDLPQHIFVARWVRGGQAVPVWSSSAPDGVEVTRMFGVVAEPDGRQLMGTWNHFDYGKQKPAEDYVYRFDLDPFSGLERTQLLSGKEADAMKVRLCGAQGASLGLARGQDSALCQPAHPRAERRPVTTPPANNQGRSTPPGARR